MRQLILLTLLCSLTTFAAEPAPGLQDDAAGQALLSERIARAYVWRGLEADNAEARRQLQTASAQFELKLAKLRAGSQDNAELADDYALLAQLWADYQTLTQAPATREGAARLAELSEELAWIARKASDRLAQPTGNKPQPNRIAADIATLSQRLAKTYLLQAYGLKVAFLQRDLIESRAAFLQLSQQLKALPDNTPALQAKLALMDSQWFFFQQAIDELAKRNTDPQLRRNVITTSDRIYEVALDLAAQYQRRGKS